MTTKIETVLDAPAKQKRGRPPKIEKADILDESSATDVWLVRNPDLNMVYKWGKKNDDWEMNLFAQYGYVPARGAEKIFGNPFESTQMGEGQTKERGYRILMCCPKHLVEARKKARAARQVNASTVAKQEARNMMRENPGLVIKSEAEEITRQENIKE